jgi:hypothetical protein
MIARAPMTASNRMGALQLKFLGRGGLLNASDELSLES